MPPKRRGSNGAGGGGGGKRPCNPAASSGARCGIECSGAATRCGECGTTLSTAQMLEYHTRHEVCRWHLHCRLCNGGASFKAGDEWCDDCDGGDCDGDGRPTYHGRSVAFCEHSRMWKKILAHFGHCKRASAYFEGHAPLDRLDAMFSLGYRGRLPAMGPADSDTALRRRLLYLAAFSPYSAGLRGPEERAWWAADRARGVMRAGRRVPDAAPAPDAEAFLDRLLPRGHCVPRPVAELAHDCRLLRTRPTVAGLVLGDPRLADEGPDSPASRLRGFLAVFGRDRPKHLAALEPELRFFKAFYPHWQLPPSVHPTLAQRLQEATEAYRAACRERHTRWCRGLRPPGPRGLFVAARDGGHATRPPVYMSGKALHAYLEALREHSARYTQHAEEGATLLPLRSADTVPLQANPGDVTAAMLLKELPYLLGENPPLAEYLEDCLSLVDLLG